MSTENNKKYTNEDLKIMQAWPLERKIQVSQTRILEWYTKWGGQVYVSFSGGKDSTVLLDLVRRMFPEVPAVFVDTGLEYPELRQFVKTIDNVTWLKPEMNFRQVIQTYGYPVVSKEIANKFHDINTAKQSGIESYAIRQLNGTYISKNGKSCFNISKWKFLLDAPFKISHWCCRIMKKNPAKKYEKETGRKPYMGLLANESRLRRNNWIKRGCNAFDAPRPESNPLSFWTEQDILEYISKFNLPYASVYGDIIQDDKGKYHTTGCTRTGCVFCGFGCHLEKEPNRFQRLKETHPRLWDYCMRPWDQGGLGMKEVLEYIGVKVE